MKKRISDILEADHDKEEKRIRILFKALNKVKDQLGEKTYQEIRYRLVVGSQSRQEAKYLQDLRRQAAKDYLDGKSHKEILKNQGLPT